MAVTEWPIYLGQHFQEGQAMVCTIAPQLSLLMKSPGCPYLYQEATLLSEIKQSAQAELFPCADEARL